MPIRVAKYGDLRVIAEVLAAAFDGEELNSYFFPYRKEYYADYVKAWYHVVLEKWWNYNSIWLVSYIKSTEAESREIITGASQWERAGDGAEKVWNVYSWDPRRLILPVVERYLNIERIVLTNRSIGRPSTDDQSPMRKWEFGSIVFPFIEHFYTEPAYRRNHWQLDLLGVHPDHRKYGHGAELIAWGINRAKEDRLPAVVIMADGLEDYYRKQGFEVLVGYASEKDLVIEEKQKDGSIVKKTLLNPLRSRKIGGGGIAWTNFKDKDK